MDNKAKLGLLLLLFCALSVVFQNITVSHIAKDSRPFTMFEFIAPTSVALFSPAVGVAAILFSEFIQRFVLNQFEYSLFNVVRLFTLVAAAYYFGTVLKDKKFGIVLPIAGMLLFWIHPVGAQAWAYALLWIIPIAATFLSGNLLFRSLGATFQAHVIGSVAYLYLASSFGPEYWMALIPLVLVERATYAAGIALTFIAFNSLLEFAKSEWKVSLPGVHVEKQYSLLRAKKEG
ncbi:MAG: hypothetical protein QXH30_02615 [Candidatus Bilamarchaeaceae archaeon]